MSDTTTEKLAEVEKMPGAAEAPVGPQITLQDLAFAVQVIDIASRRGAFEGAELKSIGTLRSNITDFLEAAKASAQQNKQG